MLFNFVVDITSTREREHRPESGNINRRARTSTRANVSKQSPISISIKEQ
ncbi:hypothetical protein [Lentibacillus sp. Marseille-P4043]|nr:hypothetical protein [Lentibacillus sp. Marseille-P4043]